MNNSSKHFKLPYRANNQSLYIETLIVIDADIYRLMHKKMNIIHYVTKMTMNKVNAVSNLTNHHYFYLKMKHFISVDLSA